MRGGVVALALLSILHGCGKEAPAPGEIGGQSLVSEALSLKEYKTGVPMPQGLSDAVKNPMTWTYFGKPRSPKVTLLKDGTVAEISVPLTGFVEGANWMLDTEQKMREAGSRNFSLSCTEWSGRMAAGGVDALVKKQTCLAGDGRQILRLESVRPMYAEPELDKSPELKKQFDAAVVTLSDPALVDRHREADPDFQEFKKQREGARKDL